MGEPPVLDRIWNGWRADYVAGAADHQPGDGTADDRASVFTRLLESGLDDEQLHIVRRAEHCCAMLNAYPYAPGHVLVLPYREVADLEDLGIDEITELWSIVSEAVVAIKSAYDPDGLNIGVNLGRAAGGSVAQHLHVHVVPRWVGDANFMTAVANTRTIPEALDQSAERLRGVWPVDGAAG
jgi:ATP adenylyltransferase